MTERERWLETIGWPLHRTLMVVAVLLPFGNLELVLLASAVFFATIVDSRLKLASVTWVVSFLTIIAAHFEATYLEALWHGAGITGGLAAIERELHEIFVPRTVGDMSRGEGLGLRSVVAGALASAVAIGALARRPVVPARVDLRTEHLFETSFVLIAGNALFASVACALLDLRLGSALVVFVAGGLAGGALTLLAAVGLTFVLQLADWLWLRGRSTVK